MSRKYKKMRKEIYKSLGYPLRIDIILALFEEKMLTFTELRRKLGIAFERRALLDYHLEKLKKSNIIEYDTIQEKYKLTQIGEKLARKILLLEETIRDYKIYRKSIYDLEKNLCYQYDRETLIRFLTNDLGLIRKDARLLANEIEDFIDNIDQEHINLNIFIALLIAFLIKRGFYKKAEKISIYGYPAYYFPHILKEKKDLEKNLTFQYFLSKTLPENIRRMHLEKTIYFSYPYAWIFSPPSVYYRTPNHLFSEYVIKNLKYKEHSIDYVLQGLIDKINSSTFQLISLDNFNIFLSNFSRNISDIELKTKIACFLYTLDKLLLNNSKHVMLILNDPGKDRESSEIYRITEAIISALNETISSSLFQLNPIINIDMNLLLKEKNLWEKIYLVYFYSSIIFKKINKPIFTDLSISDILGKTIYRGNIVINFLKLLNISPDLDIILDAIIDILKVLSSFLEEYQKNTFKYNHNKIKTSYTISLYGLNLLFIENRKYLFKKIIYQLNSILKDISNEYNFNITFSSIIPDVNVYESLCLPSFMKILNNVYRKSTDVNIATSFSHKEHTSLKDLVNYAEIFQNHIPGGDILNILLKARPSYNEFRTFLNIIYKKAIKYLELTVDFSYCNKCFSLLENKPARCINCFSTPPILRYLGRILSYYQFLDKIPSLALRTYLSEKRFTRLQI